MKQRIDRQARKPIVCIYIHGHGFRKRIRKMSSFQVPLGQFGVFLGNNQATQFQK